MNTTVDVVIIGDGPAGSALAKAAPRRGLDTCLVGPDADWAGDLRLLGRRPRRSQQVTSVPVADLFAVDDVPIWRLVTDRRAILLAAVRRARQRCVADRSPRRGGSPDGHVERVERRRRITIGSCWRPIDDPAARLVIDAAGWPSRFAPPGAPANAAQPAWQTGVGRRAARAAADGDLGTPTLMDFRPVRARALDRESTIGPAGVTSFAYSLPVRRRLAGGGDRARGASRRRAGRPARPTGRPARPASRRAARRRRAQRVRPHPDGRRPAGAGSARGRVRCGRRLHPSCDRVLGRRLVAGGARVVDGIAARLGDASGVMDSIRIVWDAVVADSTAPDPGVPRLRPRHADAPRRRRAFASSSTTFFDLPSTVVELSADRCVAGRDRRGDDGGVQGVVVVASSTLAGGNPVALARLLARDVRPISDVVPWRVRSVVLSGGGSGSTAARRTPNRSPRGMAKMSH